MNSNWNFILNRSFCIYFCWFSSILFTKFNHVHCNYMWNSCFLLNSLTFSLNRKYKYTSFVVIGSREVFTFMVYRVHSIHDIGYRKIVYSIIFRHGVLMNSISSTFFYIFFLEFIYEEWNVVLIVQWKNFHIDSCYFYFCLESDQSYEIF